MPTNYRINPSIPDSKVHTARQQAAQEVESHLRNLTANLFRITRGSGKPLSVVNEMRYFLDAYADYKSTFTERYNPLNLKAMLSIEYSLQQDIDRDIARILDAEDRVIRAALQIAASRLLAQPSHEGAGRNEFYSSLGEFRRAHEKRQNIKVATVPFSQKRTRRTKMSKSKSIK